MAMKANIRFTLINIKIRVFSVAPTVDFFISEISPKLVNPLLDCLEWEMFQSIKRLIYILSSASVCFCLGF